MQEDSVTITIVNNLEYTVAIKFFFDPFNTQSRCVGYLQPNESVSYAGACKPFTQHNADHFNMKYPLYYQFVYSGNWYGPSISLTKENDNKTFELYSLSKNDDKIHQFECRELH